MNTEDAIRSRFAALKDQLDERQIRIFAASEANAFGYGGILIVSKITGLAPSTIGRGLKDIMEPDLLTGVIRRPGAGRHSVADACSTLLDDLRIIVEPLTMGDPLRPCGTIKPEAQGGSIESALIVT